MLGSGRARQVPGKMGVSYRLCRWAWVILYLFSSMLAMVLLLFYQIKRTEMKQWLLERHFGLLGCFYIRVFLGRIKRANPVLVVGFD